MGSVSVAGLIAGWSTLPFSSAVSPSGKHRAYQRLATSAMGIILCLDCSNFDSIRRNQGLSGRIQVQFFRSQATERNQETSSPRHPALHC